MKNALTHLNDRDGRAPHSGIDMGDFFCDMQELQAHVQAPLAILVIDGRTYSWIRETRKILQIGWKRHEVVDASRRALFQADKGY